MSRAGCSGCTWPAQPCDPQYPDRGHVGMHLVQLSRCRGPSASYLQDASTHSASIICANCAFSRVEHLKRWPACYRGQSHRPGKPLPCPQSAWEAASMQPLPKDFRDRLLKHKSGVLAFMYESPLTTTRPSAMCGSRCNRKSLAPSAHCDTFCATFLYLNRSQTRPSLMPSTTLTNPSSLLQIRL